jgi:ribosome maturation factor RimP
LLRIFIDSEAGITVDDCARVSGQVGAALDVDDLIPVAYILEVSSPGLDRVLFKPEHYAAYIGEQAKIRTRLAIEKRRNFVGQLVSNTDTQVSISVDGVVFEVPYDIIDRGRLVLDVRPKRKGSTRT